MRSNWMKSMTALVVLAGSALAMQQVQAGCGIADQAGARPTVFRPDASGAGLMKTGEHGFYDPPFHGAPFSTAEITGLWKFAFISDGTGTPGGPPLDAPADSGFVTWHDDGTELMNSGRSPASGSFCMGVWKQTGPLTYKLNHWALSWIPDYHPGQTHSWGQVPGGVDQALQYAGPTNITETITLSRDGTRYAGKFSIKVYRAAPNSPNVTDYDLNTPPFVINGTISATRVTVN
jgi:hypothetical protein